MGTIRSKALTESAQGEECTLRLAGICSYRTDTTVWAHLPDESKGGSTKADDISGCYACQACHDVIDGRCRTHTLTAEDREWYMRRAQTRSMRRLLEKGILILKGMK